MTSGVNNLNIDHTLEIWKMNSYPLYRVSLRETDSEIFLHLFDLTTRIHA